MPPHWTLVQFVIFNNLQKPLAIKPELRLVNERCRLEDGESRLL